MDSYFLNLEKVLTPLCQYSIIIFAIIGFLSILGIALFLFHNYKNLNLLSNHDKDFTRYFLEKYPLVSTKFINKSSQVRDIENNQEIHEINKKLELYDKKMEHFDLYIKEMHNKIQVQLDMICERFKERG